MEVEEIQEVVEVEEIQEEEDIAVEDEEQDDNYDKDEEKAKVNEVSHPLKEETKPQTEPETEEKAEVEKKTNYTQEEIEAELKRMQEDTVGRNDIPTKEDATKSNPDLPAEASAQAGQEKKSKKKKKSKKPKEEAKVDVERIDDPSIVEGEDVGRIDNPSMEESTTVKKVEEEPESKEIIYRVQIAASRSPLQDSDLRLQGIQDVTTQKDIDGWYRYFAGSYRDFKSAKTRLNEIIKKGIKDAWISKYKGNKRMID